MASRFIFFSAILLLVLFSKPSSAGAFENGEEAYHRRDYKAAMAVLYPLAEKGHREAQFDCAEMYRMGLGVPQNFLMAQALYLSAAYRGYSWAQNNLGSMYEHGLGVLQDYEIAYMWFSIATMSAGADGDSDAVGKFMGNRELVAAKMTPDQIAGAQRRARDWLVQK